MRLYLVLQCLAFLSGSQAFAIPAELGLENTFPNAIDARALVCNQDNCLRFVRDAGRNPVTASSFCQSYISSTPGTITVTAFTTSSTVPAQPTVTSLTGVTTTTVEFVAVTTAPGNTQYIKRAVPFEQQASSACTSANKIVPSARISSACSCFLTSATTISTSTIIEVQPTPATTTILEPYAATETTSVAVSTSTVIGAPAIVYTTCDNLASPYNSLGKQFITRCDYSYYYTQATKISTTRTVSFKQCIDQCSLTLPECVGIFYQASSGVCISFRGFLNPTGQPHGGGVRSIGDASAEIEGRNPYA